MDDLARRLELPKLKGALTRAKNSGDPRKVIAEVERAYARFDLIGWPDQWSTWESARRDAEYKLYLSRRDSREQ